MATGEAIPLRGLEGVPGLPGAPQDEAGLTRKFETTHVGVPTMRETQVQSLGWEDLLEKEMATHSSILAWRIPRTEEPGRLQSMEFSRPEHWSG